MSLAIGNVGIVALLIFVCRNSLLNIRLNNMVITINLGKLLLTILLLIADAFIAWYLAKWYYTKKK